MNPAGYNEYCTFISCDGEGGAGKFIFLSEIKTEL